MKFRPRVALLIETSNAYARDLLHGIRSFLSEHESWSIYLSEHGRGDILPPWLHKWKGDGIIARVENRKIADAIVQLKIPTVDVSVGLQRSPFPRVATDSHAVARMAAEHLIERGFRNFGYCGDANYHWSNLRSCFFSDHLSRAGYRCSIFEGVAPGHSSKSWEHEISELAVWLKKLPKPVGILACYDIRGQHVLEACRRADLLVPDEVAVIGVHNDELLCDLCDPPLTSVIPNARRAGYEAAALLDRILHGQQVGAQVILLEPIGIATRQSTDAVALTDAAISKAVRVIRDRACQGLTVEELMKSVSLSRTVFERRFRKLLNRTPHEQISRVRIERAKALLSTTDLPTAQIAEKVGFDHVEYFHVVFKKLAGETPARFRYRSRA
jgi:LacI family transcriptional regulator